FPRAEVHGDHILVRQPSDGWGPLCEALGCPVPDEPFPRLNDSAEFRAQSGWD
ncbi:MAG: sulfotransferase family protein, partial [Acidimicrobiia bacterium]|nr:sulfotransferase family protein [Acidimicrobiia bacterium]